MQEASRLQNLVEHSLVQREGVALVAHNFGSHYVYRLLSTRIFRSVVPTNVKDLRLCLKDIAPPPDTVFARNRPTRLFELSRIKDYCHSVVWFSPREHASIRLSKATSFQRSSNAGVGFDDRLPLELLLDVLLHLDMQSLFIFRQTNLRSRKTVDYLKQYQMVVSHGLNVFCALLRTRTAIGVSLFDFYDALCTKACTLCGEFGGFTSLVTWNRCCFRCLQVAPDTEVQSLAAVRKRFRLTKAKSKQLRSFKTLPGKYSMEETLHKRRITVVSVRQAMLISGHQPQGQVQAQPASLRRNLKFNFVASCALPYYDRRTEKVEYGISCAGCQLAPEKEIIGSRGERWAFEARDKVYAQDGFLEHFRWCEQAQLLWRSSGEGKHLPTELP